MEFYFPPAKAGGYSRNRNEALARFIIVFFWSQKWTFIFLQLKLEAIQGMGMWL